MHVMKIAGIVVLAALSGWFARGIRFERKAEPAPAPRMQRLVVQSEPAAAEPVPEIRRVPLDAGSLGQRNLFAYRVQERPVAYVVEAPAPVAVPPPAIVVREEPRAPEPVPFPYGYIGTFGPAHNRLAAFKRDGDIVTVRAGERVGDFVLRSIGVESAEVEGPDGVRRIPLSADH